MTALPASPEGGLAVTGLSAICPVGLDAAAACAALHAGVSRLAELEGFFCLPPEGVAAEGAGEPEPIVAGRVPTLPAEASGRERLELLAISALQRALTSSDIGRADLPRTGLLVALPAPDPIVATWELEKRFIPQLCRRAGVGDWAAAHCIQAGPAGTFRAIDAAKALLGTGKVDRCVVLSADTYLDPERLAMLDAGWRIRSQRNPDGFLPGEAATALVLEPARAAARRKVPILGLIAGPHFGSEPVTVSADRWSTGRGLADAIRPLLGGPEGAVGRYLLCNMNGEAYPAREWTIAQSRLAPDLPAVESLLHPADAIGEAGTAMAGILVACACHAFARAHAPSPVALLWVGSDDGGRAALVVRPGA